jgi:hypothetical protein
VPNPLSSIGHALVALAQHVDVLPATGGAVEDLVHPEMDERVDYWLNAQERIFDSIIESPSRELYRPVPPIPRSERHTFRLFLDGSFRSYFLGTALEEDRDSPVHFAQLGAALLRRLDDGNVKLHRLAMENALFLARSKLSEVAWEALAQACQKHGVHLEDISQDDQISKHMSGDMDLRNRAAGKVRFRMHVLETKLTLEGLGELERDEWMIVDGSLFFQPLLRELLEREEPRVLGVAKSFRRDPEFKVGRGPKAERFNITRLLAGLENARRTAAFGAQDGRIAFWYVRIRPQGAVDYPLMGVIKVEMANPGQGPVDTDLIDLLSRCLVAERSVTPYGAERRWHACLYPIYLAEQAVKIAFLSREVIRAALRWPIPVRG